jgi:hypothetical protein
MAVYTLPDLDARLFVRLWLARTSRIFRPDKIGFAGF